MKYLYYIATNSITNDRRNINTGNTLRLDYKLNSYENVSRFIEDFNKQNNFSKTVILNLVLLRRFFK